MRGSACRLPYKLRQRRVADTVCVHLINQEVLGDEEEEDTNIDISGVDLFGWRTSLSAGTTFAQAGTGDAA